MNNEREKETEKFIAEREKLYGGKIDWRTYATWFASSDSTIREYGVLIYRIDGTYYIEDFERENTLLGFAMKKSSKAPAYVKYLVAFSRDQIDSAVFVSKKKAEKTVASGGDCSEVNRLSLYDKVFGQSVLKVKLVDGTCYFFECIDRKDCMANFSPQP